MPEVRQNGLDSLDRSFQELLKKTPEKRKELHERIADRLKETIDAKIVEHLDDSDGKVQGWQEKAVGSGGDTLLSVRKRAKLEITAREQSRTIWREGTESALQEGEKIIIPASTFRM